MKRFYPLAIQIVLKGGFSMNRILDVRSVGWLQNLKEDLRSPESFAFPACMTSLMEHIGEDARWKTIHAHGREWTKRRLYDDFLAATGMSFGLLWHKDNCPSCMDLTQVNDHNKTITLAFDYAGYDSMTVERTDSNLDKMKQTITSSIDSGYPVLAFGIIGPPECAIVCGYDCNGDTLFGWSHFQSYRPEDCYDNGMFRVTDWHKNTWKIVLCKDKKGHEDDLKSIIQRGCAIMEARELSGYYAGTAAYAKWIGYVKNPAYEAVSDEELRGIYWLHRALVGNHAEARCYLGDFLRERARGDEHLEKAAQCCGDIHDTCWEVWNTAGGFNAEDGYKHLRNKHKRDEIASLLEKIKNLDLSALANLNAWLKT